MTDPNESGSERDAVPKPDELLALHDVTAQMFDILRGWFDVPEHVTLDLRAVDSAVAELGEPVLIAAMAMRKLQALHLLATPGVLTTTDVVVSIVQDLQRALVQAPNMRLKLRAATTDWDAALADLADLAEAAGAAGEDTGGTGPVDTRAPDPEVEGFRILHGALLEAVEAVLRATDGEIRYLL